MGERHADGQSAVGHTALSWSAATRDKKRHHSSRTAIGRGPTRYQLRARPIWVILKGVVVAQHPWCPVKNNAIGTSVKRGLLSAAPGVLARCTMLAAVARKLLREKVKETPRSRTVDRSIACCLCRCCWSVESPRVQRWLHPSLREAPARPEPPPSAFRSAGWRLRR